MSHMLLTRMSFNMYCTYIQILKETILLQWAKRPKLKKCPAVLFNNQSLQIIQINYPTSLNDYNNNEKPRSQRTQGKQDDDFKRKIHSITSGTGCPSLYIIHVSRFSATTTVLTGTRRIRKNVHLAIFLMVEIDRHAWCHNIKKCFKYSNGITGSETKSSS